MEIDEAKRKAAEYIKAALALLEPHNSGKWWDENGVPTVVVFLNHAARELKGTEP